ncbi:hypothetical protein BIFAD42_12890 [Bifidobacterium adolescentis]|uniref:Uncharacterized protein n=2 Tax=Bifidobacterium adolescentis TaxID=1680 RepID=A0AAN4VM70_BIFAD|nr:hypothetical protein BIFAD42_12890 [Bifidobacterium adolescentis]
MPRYTLTLIDSTNQTPPIVLTAESTRTIIRQLTKRLDPTPERRRGRQGPQEDPAVLRGR